MTNVLLIDLSSIAHPLYHVSVPPFSDVSTKTVERVRALASGQPHVGVCVEGGRSFRKDLDPSYKANRPESDAALYHQIDLAIDTLRADGFPILRADGFEADDVIASAAALITNSFPFMPNRGGPAEVIGDTVIASADKDLLQLVGKRVNVKSLKDGSIIDAVAVEAKFGVRPDQMLDYLALCGDTSDNIKGCKDVGKTRAAGLLKKYGTLSNIFKALDNIGEFTPALETSLREFHNRALGVCELLRLRTDAPIDVSEVLKERVPADVAEFGTEEESQVPANVVESGPENGGLSAPVSRPPSGVAPSHQDNSGQLITLEPAPVEWERQLEPRNMAQVKSVSMDMFASRMFSQYGHPAAVMATILAGREFGLPMMASLRSFHNIDGKQTLAADLIRGLVLRSGVVDYFRPTERTNERCTFVGKRKGDPEISLTFTIEDARRAWQKGDKAWEGSGYNRNPADMLVARAGAKLARLVAPDVVSGLYAREELE